jgi:peptide/nickel transport system substrate-binding protein
MLTKVFARQAWIYAGAVALGLGAMPAAADDITIGVAVEPGALDPHFHNTQQNLQIARHLFDFLIVRDSRQQLRPGLAESWRAIDDKTWELKLRKDVKWHDGAPFTADDVIFSAARVPNVPNSPGSYATYVRGKEFVKIDNHTLQVKTQDPYPLMPNDLATFAIISKKHGEGATTQDYNSGKAAVGTGPYKLVGWSRGDRITLAANPNYWGGKPKWDKVTFKVISSGPSRVAELLAGGVDLIDKVPPADIKNLKANPAMALSQSPSNRLMYYAPDSNRHITPHVKTMEGAPMMPNPLRDARVRKAISMAINRDAIVERVMEGSAVAAGQMVPEGFFGSNSSLKPEPYNPEGAKKLLAEAGYGQGFQLSVHGSNDRYVNDGKIVEAVGGMLSRIGIKVDVVTLPISVYLSRGSALEFSFAMFAYGSDTGEASSPLNGVLHTYNKATGQGAFNRARYSNVLFDQAIDTAMVTVDDGKREKLLQDATAIAVSDYAFIPLHWEVNTWAHKAGLTYEARTDENTLAESVSKR